MLDSPKIKALEQRLREAREDLSRNWDKHRMSRRAADDAIDRIDGLLNDLEQLSREAKTYKREPDEDYMDHYNRGVHKRQPDEDYMDNYRGDEDASEMVNEFGEPHHQRIEAQKTDDEKYDRVRPHEHMAPEAPEYHIDDDTGVNTDMKDRFGSQLCEKCRRSRRRR